MARVPAELRGLPVDGYALVGSDVFAPRNPAEKAVERLGEEIASFEAGLSNDEEVGGIIIGAPGNTTFHIIKFYSLNRTFWCLRASTSMGSHSAWFSTSPS